MKHQVKYFGKSRFLEMSYYLCSFYLLGKLYLARVVYCVLYSLDFEVVVVVISELVPNVLLFCVCSMVTYLW